MEEELSKVKQVSHACCTHPTCARVWKQEVIHRSCVGQWLWWMLESGVCVRRGVISRWSPSYTHTRTHTNRKGWLNSGSAKQSWQPALAYSQPFTINTVKWGGWLLQCAGKVRCPWVNQCTNCRQTEMSFHAWIIRPRHLVYGFVNLELAKWQRGVSFVRKPDGKRKEKLGSNEQKSTEAR